MASLQLRTLWAFLSCLSLAVAIVPCKPRPFAAGIVCVCNALYCDEVGQIPTTVGNEFIQYTSNIGGLRFEMTKGTFEDTIQTDALEMTIDYSKTYQKILGFGGSFTDAAGININLLSPTAQDKLLRSYFSPDGIELNMARVPIAGCDFSTHTYSYADTPNDDELIHFNLTMEDYEYKLPLMHQAIAMSERTINFVTAAWTAPPWMKRRNIPGPGGAGWAGGHLRQKYYQTWADYLIKFLDAYKEEGIDFWSMSTGNEPLGGILPVYGFNSMAWTPDSQFEWIRTNLGPSLKNSSHSMIKIYANDDQRIMIPWWINAMKNDTEAADYIAGIGVHWYLDRVFDPRILDKAHEAFPDKFILGTEACVGDKPWEEIVNLGAWDRGERYMQDIIEDLNHWVGGWIDWNLALNMSGGPNWSGNYVDAAIIVNEKDDEFYKQPMYYALGHFSKFITRDSVRVQISPNIKKQVQSIVFQTPDNKTVVVLYNNNDATVPVTIIDPVKGNMNLILSEKSFQTLVYENGVSSIQSSLFALLICFLYVLL